MKATITSNYPMFILKVIAKDKKGKTTELIRRYFDRMDVGNGKARKYMVIEDQPVIKAALDGLDAGEYTITASVTVSTGEAWHLVRQTGYDELCARLGINGDK